MENHMKLTILTPEKEFYSGEILSLNTENDHGRFGVLANHVNTIAPLTPTVTKFIDLDGKALKAFTGVGILRVNNDGIEMLCSVCEWPEDIDKERASRAKERAEDRLTHKDKIDVKRTESAILRAVMRMKTKE